MRLADLCCYVTGRETCILISQSNRAVPPCALQNIDKNETSEEEEGEEVVDIAAAAAASGLHSGGKLVLVQGPGVRVRATPSWTLIGLALLYSLITRPVTAAALPRHIIAPANKRLFASAGTVNCHLR